MADRRHRKTLRRARLRPPSRPERDAANSPVALVGAAATGVPGAKWTYESDLGYHDFEVLTPHVPDDNILVDLIAGRLGYRYRAKLGSITYPSDFVTAWDAVTSAPDLPDVRRSADGHFYAPWEDIADFRDEWAVKAGDTGATGDQTYYVSSAGSDAASGDSRTTSLKTIPVAWGKADCLNIVVFGGGWVEVSGTPDKSINVFVEDDTFLFRLPQANDFTLHAGSVWKIDSGSNFSFTEPYYPRLDSHGLPQPYGIKVSTLVEVDAPGKWFSDPSNPKSLYVYWADPAGPTVGVDLLTTYHSWTGGWFRSTFDNTGNKIYIEGAVFPQPIRAIGTGTEEGTLVLRNVRAVGSVGNVAADSDPIVISNINAVLSNCLFGHIRADGFDHAAGEWYVLHRNRSVSYVGTSSGAVSNQPGSTVHGDVNVLRIEELYAVGPNSSIADVGDGVSLNLGVRFAPSAYDPIYTIRSTRDGAWSLDCGILGTASQGDFGVDGASAEHRIDGDLSGLTNIDEDNGGVVRLGDL